MQKKFSFMSHFNWKILLLRLLNNALALILVGMLTPKVYFVDPKLGSILLVALVLGVLNAIIKPVLLFITGQLFFVTFGLVVIVINTFLLYLLEWLLPTRFAVDSLIWALVGGAILGLASNGLDNLLGLTPPIVPEAEAEIRREIREKSLTPLQSLAGITPATVAQNVDTQSLEEIQAARATLEVINGEAVSATPAETPEDLTSSDQADVSPGELPPQEEESAPGGDAPTDNESPNPGGQA